MHNCRDADKHNGHKSMMWMMVICCLLPVVILFGGAAFLESLGYNWIGIGLIGVLVVIYLIKKRQAKHDCSHK